MYLFIYRLGRSLPYTAIVISILLLFVGERVCMCGFQRKAKNSFKNMIFATCVAHV